MNVQKLILQYACKFCKGKYAHSTATSRIKENIHDNRVDSWQIHSYGGLEELQLTSSRTPIINKPNEVLVKVMSTSVNPIDLAMIGGYGSTMLNVMRQADTGSFQNLIEFPLTLGRDFSGIIIDKGHSVGAEYQMGEAVWGVVPPHQQGCHSKTVVLDKSFIHKKPNNISFVEAGAMLYAAVTAWSSLKVTSDLCLFPAKGKSVLVLGGSGGVGSMAVQLLRSWGAHVVATCSTDAVPFVESLGVPVVIDYTKNDSDILLQQEGRYDIILDCAGLGQNNATQYTKLLKEYNFSKFVTLKSPLLKNVDDFGVIGGMVKNAGDLLFSNLSTGLITKSSSVRWGFFIPMQTSLSDITKQVENGRLVPCIDSTFAFEQMPSAYEKVKNGHLRGKVAVNIEEKL